MLVYLKKVTISFFRSIFKNKQLGTYIFFFFISSAFWFLSMLSRTHETTLNIPVRYINYPINLVEVEEPDNFIKVRIKAAGISIISFYLFNSKKLVLNYDIANSKLKEKGKIFFWIMNSVRKEISYVLGSKIEIINISPDKLASSFVNKKKKEVSIILNSDISLKKEYWLKDEYVLEPSSVVLYGKEEVLDSIVNVTTDLLKIDGLYKDEMYEVALHLPNSLESNTKSIEVHLEAEPFIEEIITKDVEIRNLKKGYSIKVFPRDVRVTLRMSKDKYQLLKLDFLNLYIDASICDGEKTIPIYYDNLPASVKVVRIYPNQLEYLLIKE